MYRRFAVREQLSSNLGDDLFNAEKSIGGELE